MSGFLLTGEGMVGPEWIDDNDHVNMMWYTHLVDIGTAGLMRQIGVEQADGLTYVAARLATAYRRELRLGDKWAVWSAISDVTDRSIVSAHKIMTGNVIAARSDMTIVFFDKSTRLSAALPEAARAQAQAACIALTGGVQS